VIASNQGKSAERRRLEFVHVIELSETDASNAPVDIEPARRDWTQMRERPSHQSANRRSIDTGDRNNDETDSRGDFSPNPFAELRPNVMAGAYVPASRRVIPDEHENGALLVMSGSALSIRRCRSPQLAPRRRRLQIVARAAGIR